MILLSHAIKNKRHFGDHKSGHLCMRLLHISNLFLSFLSNISYKLFLCLSFEKLNHLWFFMDVVRVLKLQCITFYDLYLLHY
jgi:hypothetical protein